MTHILFIEDENVARTMGIKVLEELGLDYDIAETGQQALTHLEKMQYDLVLCDLGLPDMTGFEITRKLRRGETKFNQKTPVFALTAHDNDEYRQRALASGMTGLLAKPFTIETCSAVLKKVYEYHNEANQMEIH